MRNDTDIDQKNADSPVTKAQAPYPYLGINDVYLDKAFLDGVWEQLLESAPSWMAGIIEPTPAERLAYLVMTQITLRNDVLNEGFYAARNKGADDAARKDDAAVDRFAAAMKEKLAKARAKGRDGWDDPALCSTDFLIGMLRGHMEKGNPGNWEDLANIAMMLHQRGADPKELVPSGKERADQGKLIEAANQARLAFAGHVSADSAVRMLDNALGDLADKSSDQEDTAAPEAFSSVRIWTDGACSGNPGPGGWGALLRGMDGETVSHEWTMRGGAQETTNNRMELIAAIKAIEGIDEPCRIILTTDSQYVKDGITMWISKWKKNGWKASGGKPVKNVELWQRLDAACAKHDVEWAWVRGHAGHPENEMADEIARAGMAPFKKER